MKDKLLICGGGIAAILLAAMMFFATPSGVGPLGILVFLLASYVIFLVPAVFVCRLFFVLRGKLNRAKAGGAQRKSYFYGPAIAVAPLILLVSNSFGGVSWVEILSVILLEILLCLLVSRDIL